MELEALLVAAQDMMQQQDDEYLGQINRVHRREDMEEGELRRPKRVKRHRSL